MESHWLCLNSSSFLPKMLPVNSGPKFLFQLHVLSRAIPWSDPFSGWRHHSGLLAWQSISVVQPSGLAPRAGFSGTWAEERKRKLIQKVQRLICDGTKLLQKP